MSVPKWVNPNSAYCSRVSWGREGGRDGEGHLPNKLETFARADIPFPSLFHFSEYPWLDECAPSDHDTVYAGAIDFFPIIMGGEAVASAKDWDGGH